MSLQLVCTVFLVHICSAIAAREESFSVPVDEKATACGLDGFQIDILSQASHWSVPFAPEHLDKCVVPNGYERHQISSCKLHFSICGTIPEGVCGGYSNSTTCQEVETEDGHRHYYSIGGSRESNKLKPFGHSPSDGFFTVRHGNPIHHHGSCHGPYKITLKFVCDKDRMWNPHSHDASPHVHVVIKSDPCHLKIVFGYSGACRRDAPTLAPAINSCLFPPYNLTGLTSREYWFARVPNNLCYKGRYSKVHACTIYFAFCQPLPAIVDKTLKLGPNCTGAAICQTSVVDNDHPPPFEKGLSYSMGQFKTFTRFFFNGKMVGGGFHMDVGNGTSIPECRNGGIKTRIALACNYSAVWSSQDLTRILHVEKIGHCEYSFVLPYNGACLPVFPNATVLPSTVHPKITTPSKINSIHIHPHPTSIMNRGASVITPVTTPVPYSAPTLAPATNNSCLLPPYDTTGLTSRDYWFAHVKDNFCYNDGYRLVHACVFYFAFCRALPAVVYDKVNISSNCTGAAVCQTAIVDTYKPPFNKGVTYSMGQLKNFTGFSYNNEMVGGGFHTDVGNGTNVPECRNGGIKTHIVLTCNSSAVWSSQDLTRILHVEKIGHCEYTFVLPYNGACLPVFPNATVLPSTAHPTMTTPSKINSTSIHPHPTSTVKPPHTSSSHHHSINSTTKHSTTPTRNSSIHTSTIHTSSHRHTINSTTKHSSTPTRSFTIHTSTTTVTTPTSSRQVATTTVAYSTTTAPHVVTTSATPGNRDRRIILGLTVGLALFGFLSVVLLVMVIIAARYVIKKNRKLKFTELKEEKT